MPNHPLQHVTLAVVGLLALASAIGCTGEDATHQPTSIQTPTVTSIPLPTPITTPPTTPVSTPTPTPSPSPTQSPTPTATIVPTKSVSPTKEVKYSTEQLRAWRDSLRDALTGRGLLILSEVSTKTGQIILHTYALRDVRKLIEAKMSRRGIPSDALLINIGCERAPSPSIYSQASSDEPFFHSIELLLEIPEQAVYGEPVPMRVTIKNISDEQVGFQLFGGPPHDFIVSQTDGKGVWNWGCKRPRRDAIFGERLEPGKEMMFSSKWQQVNSRGDPVPPGIYVVHGLISFGGSPTATKPHHIQILPP